MLDIHSKSKIIVSLKSYICHVAEQSVGEKTVKLRGITIIMSKFADADRPE